MDRQSEDRDQVRRLKLPSGKQIDVVVFGTTPRRSPAGEAAEVTDAPDRELHLCRCCGSDLVHPIDWEEVASDNWRLQLRCPNCEWIGEGTFDQGTVEQLDVELDNGTQVLVRDLRQLMHANMEEEVERFAAALHAGHIWPMDF